MRKLGEGPGASFEFHRFAEENAALVYRPFPRGLAAGSYALADGSGPGVVFENAAQPKIKTVFFAPGATRDELVCGMDATRFVFRRATS